MNRKIILSSQEFTYALTKKKVKNINIRVNTDGMISVSCPKYTTIKEVESVLISNEKFIRNAVEKQTRRKNSLPQDVKYIDGNKLRYFGSDKSISILPGNRNSVYVKDNIFNILVTDIKDYDLVKRTAQKFLDKQLKNKVHEISKEVYEDFKDEVKEYPKIYCRRTTSQWGSCTPKKNHLSFSLNLVYYDENCIRYVVIHEFTHFIHFNHSKDFYSHVERLMPDYKYWRNQLKEITDNTGTEDF